MAKMMEKPKNYDRSLDGLTPDWKGGMANPDPNLSTVKDFGSASRDVLKTGNKIMGGGNPTMRGVEGSKAKHGDMTGKSVEHNVSFAKDFKSSQVPSTGPTPKAIHSKVSSRSVKESSKSLILHGDPSQKGL